MTPQETEIYNHPLLVQRGRAIHECFQKGLTKHLNSQSIILDLGCGLGPYFSFYKLFDCLAIGADVDSARLAKAKQRARAMGVVSQFVRADAKYLPFKKEAIDVVVIAEVLEHMNEPDMVLKGAHRCLRKDGNAVMTVPWMREFRLRSFPSIVFLREITLLKVGYPGPFFRLMFTNARECCKQSQGKKLQTRNSGRILKKQVSKLMSLNSAFQASFGQCSPASMEDFIVAFAFGGFTEYFGHQVLYTPNEWKRLVNKTGFNVCFETGALLFPLQLWSIRPLRVVFSATEPKAHRWFRKWLSQSYVMVASAT